jgi:DNA-binding NarL/FixJ family response regulator
MHRKDIEGADQGAPLRVVLVEDHAGFRDQLCERLEALDGVRVVHVEDTAEAAVQWLGEHPAHWDLLVLDIFLADGHGFSVLRACQDRQGHQRAVFLTSYTREPARSQALALGADAVFDKVFGLDGFMRFACQCRQDRMAIQPA